MDMYNLSLRLVFVFFQEWDLCILIINCCTTNDVFSYQFRCKQQRVPRKENKRAAKVGLTLVNMRSPLHPSSRLGLDILCVEFSRLDIGK
jgi:hypothetical protein